MRDKLNELIRGGANQGARGMAVTEFALMLPIMMFIVITGMELVNQALARQQLSRMVSSAADLSARYRKRIDETDINKLIYGINLSNTLPEFDARGKVIISSVMTNAAKTGLQIAWQRCEGSLPVASKYGKQGDGATGSSITTIDGLNVLENENLLVAEIYYDYQPIMRMAEFPIFQRVSSIFAPQRMTYTAGFVSRSEELPSEATKLPANASSLPDSEKALCVPPT